MAIEYKERQGALENEGSGQATRFNWIHNPPSAPGSNKRTECSGYFAFLHLCAVRFPSCATSSSQLIEVFPVQQIALERLDNLIDFPFRPIVIAHELFNTVPLNRAVKLTAWAFIKEFTMLLTHILFVFSTIFYFHLPFSFMRSP
jgi:hypothetical protein